MNPLGTIEDEQEFMVSNRPGTLSMANIPWTAHSGSSQFFINMANNKLYDFWTKHGGRPNPEPHVVFGQVPKKREPADLCADSSPVCHTLIDTRSLLVS